MRPASPQHLLLQRPLPHFLLPQYLQLQLVLVLGVPNDGARSHTSNVQVERLEQAVTLAVLIWDGRTVLPNTTGEWFFSVDCQVDREA
jgi:hypothetical protein